MSNKLYPYNCDHTIRRYLSQVMRVFSGFQVKDDVMRDGEYRLKKVPVVYGNMTRVVASVINKNDWKNRGTIPMISVDMTGLEKDDERKMPHHHTDAIINNTTDSKEFAERIIGPPFLMNLDVIIWASSNTQLFEISEQILTIFNPRVTIQSSSDGYNSDYISYIELVSIQPEFQTPIGQDSNVTTLSLGFSVPIRLRYPYSVSSSVIEQIIMTVKDGNTEEDLDQYVIPEDNS